MRSILIGVALGLGLAGPGVAAGSRIAARSAAVSVSEASAAAALISTYRAAHGLGPVVVDQRLNHAAQYQAGVVAATGQLSHGDFAGRMAQFGIRGQSAENLGAGTQTMADTVALWAQSPGHNANLLLPGVQRIGLGRSSWSFGSSWALVLSR